MSRTRSTPPVPRTTSNPREDDRHARGRRSRCRGAVGRAGGRALNTHTSGRTNPHGLTGRSSGGDTTTCLRSGGDRGVRRMTRSRSSSQLLVRCWRSVDLRRRVHRSSSSARAVSDVDGGQVDEALHGLGLDPERPLPGRTGVEQTPAWAHVRRCAQPNSEATGTPRGSGTDDWPVLASRTSRGAGHP